MTQNCLLVCVVTEISNRVIQWCPACRYDMSNPQNLQQGHALAQILANLQQQQVVLQQQQAVLHQQQAVLHQQQTQMLNLLPQSGATANPHLPMELSPEDHHRRFRSCCMGPQEGPSAFAQRLRNDAERWLHPGPTQGEARLLEAVILEQFVEGLPREIADWVKCQELPNLEAAVRLAEGHLAARTENPRRLQPGEVSICQRVTFDVLVF